MDSYYADIQYSKKLSKNAKKDLNLLFFKSFLKDEEKILDIGCSLGRIISIDSKRIQGIDWDKKALEKCKEKGYTVNYADISKKIPFKESSFNAVYCSHVIEHLEEPLFLMNEIKRVLKKKGKVVIITPDYIMSSKKYHDGFWSDYTHKTPFIPESLKKLAYNAGFRKFRVYHFPGKGFRNLMRIGMLSKNFWIKLEKFPFIWKNQDLILECTK